MCEEARNAAISVTSHVLETMFFTFPEPRGEGDDPEIQPSAPYMEGEIGFKGGSSGRLRLYLPLELARKMASNFMGSEEDSVTESQTKDTVCELCNMICGNLCSHWDRKSIWSLTIPKARPMSWQEVIEEGKEPGLEINLDAEGHWMKLHIQFDGARQ